MNNNNLRPINLRSFGRGQRTQRDNQFEEEQQQQEEEEESESQISRSISERDRVRHLIPPRTLQYMKIKLMLACGCCPEIYKAEG